MYYLKYQNKNHHHKLFVINLLRKLNFLNILFILLLWQKLDKFLKINKNNFFVLIANPISYRTYAGKRESIFVLFSIN